MGLDGLFHEAVIKLYGFFSGGKRNHPLASPILVAKRDGEGAQSSPFLAEIGRQNVELGSLG